MAFIPKLPTFACDVRVWKYDPDTDSYTENEDDLIGQVYTQYRNQDDNTSGTLYFEYPVAQDILRDLKDYNDVGKADILVIHFPTIAPRDVAYMVRDVQPRWLEFPNEHIMATLVRLSPLEFVTLTEGGGGGEPAPAELITEGETIVAPDDICGFCDAFRGSLTLFVVTDTVGLKRWIRNILTGCYPAGIVTISVDYFVVSGNIVLSVDSPEGVGMVSYSGSSIGWDMVSAVVLTQTQLEDDQCEWPPNWTVGT